MTTAEAGPPPAARRAPRWMWIVLMISLAINLLVIGLGVGTAIAFRRHGLFWGASGMSADVVAFARGLPAERRLAVWDALAERRQGIRPAWRQVGQARREVLAALGTEPFDRARFAAAQARLLEAEAKARSASQELVAEIAARLTPSERQRLVSFRGHGMRWRWRRRAHDGDEPPGDGGPGRGPNLAHPPDKAGAPK